MVTPATPVVCNDVTKPPEGHPAVPIRSSAWSVTTPPGHPSCTVTCTEYCVLGSSKPPGRYACSDPEEAASPSSAGARSSPDTGTPSALTTNTDHMQVALEGRRAL